MAKTIMRWPILVRRLLGRKLVSLAFIVCLFALTSLVMFYPVFSYDTGMYMRIWQTEVLAKSWEPYIGKRSQLDVIGDKTALDATKKVRVLCWVMTHPGNHDKRAVHVKATWGRRCNILIFMSSVNNASLPSIDLGMAEERNYLWGKTKKAFQHVYANYLNATDWFLKADDDTYVIVENLRYMLSRYDPNFPIYFGSRFRKFSKQGYMSGGGGYVLSREALRIFVEVALSNETLCKQADTGAEDAEMGKCLNNTGVLAGDSRDELGRGRFFPFGPGTHLNPGAIAPNMWYWDYIYYPIKNGPDCCSNTAITFHYMPPHRMYELEYLIYQLHPFGTFYRDPYPLALPPDKTSIPRPLFDRSPP